MRGKKQPMKPVVTGGLAFRGWLVVAAGCRQIRGDQQQKMLCYAPIIKM
jgi:hypothetical protein